MVTGDNNINCKRKYNYHPINFIPLHVCDCLKSRPGFSTSDVVVFLCSVRGDER